MSNPRSHFFCCRQMTSICRWVQFSSLWWVSVVVGGQHSVCHTVLVPRIAQPIICWTCSVLSSGWLCVTMAVYWLLSWQGWNYKLLHGISTSPLFTWKCHSSHWHWLWQTCVSVSYSAQCAWKGLLQFLEAVKSIQFFEKKFSDHWRARLHTKWTFRSIGSIQSIWDGAETCLTFWGGFVRNIRLPAGYTACASLPEDADVISSQ